ncbi:ferredoxin [Streptomyces sp. NBC_01614]|uniref:ferredoxin n=1 Tax=Streptomyces sp. NBC_01614 TaxID=2975897 RepID=UPI00386E90F1
MDQRTAGDWTLCKGRGVCADLVPDHITLDEWGGPLVDGIPIPARPVRRARRAVANCQ